MNTAQRSGFFPDGRCRHYQLIEGWAKVYCTRTDEGHTEHETEAGTRWAEVQDEELKAALVEVQAKFAWASAMSTSDLAELIHRQAGVPRNPDRHALWCPPSPIKDDDTFVPDGGGSCVRCGHLETDHEIREAGND